MKTLIIVAHPSIETSTVHHRWIQELRKYPDQYTVHELYKAYPDGNIDVEQEQRLVEAHGNLVLQFPIYWFSSPPLLKQWIDEVFAYGWAYGSKGDKLKQRNIALGVSTGARKANYSEAGKYRHTLEQLLSPFATTFLYCNADYRSFFAFYGMESEPGENVPGDELEPAADQLERSASEYVEFIECIGQELESKFYGNEHTITPLDQQY